ncbi:MAG: hypothetical protein A2X32_10040 [Elusimicrobia bacterium GWC2_64_44]|nr:MAG: hypothetical protein A2X32_10040 [Elusimicrobia bacterium GWC2_64_44]
MSIPFIAFSQRSLYLTAVGWIILFTGVVGFMVSYRFAMRYVQGLEGERLVHDELEPIIRDDYHIINAFPAGKFDIDFVVVGPTGVYAIEVKNPSKYSATDRIVLQNGVLCLKSDKTRHTIPFRRKDPIHQARRGGEWLARYLSDVLGKKVQGLKSVVLFPKFLVDDHISSDLWVLNPKRFVFEYLPKAPKVLAPHEIGNIVSALRARVKTISDAELAETE